MIPAVSETYSILEYTPTKQPGLTYALDLENGRIAGKVDTTEALKQAIFLILSTERYKYLMYSWNYGIELTELIGAHPDVVLAELERIITEALLQDDRILALSNFDFEVNKSAIHVTFCVSSIYGTFDTETEVTI